MSTLQHILLTVNVLRIHSLGTVSYIAALLAIVRIQNVLLTLPAINVVLVAGQAALLVVINVLNMVVKLRS